MPAPYRRNITLGATTTQEWSALVDMPDGTAFPWSDYTFAYSAWPRCGDEILSDYGWTQPPTVIADTTAGTVVVDPVQGLMTFGFTTPLSCGQYRFEVVATHTATGKSVAMFDGTLIITRSA